MSRLFWIFANCCFMALVSCRCPSSSLVTALFRACAEEGEYCKRSAASRLVSVEEEPFAKSRRAHLLAVGMFRFVSDMNQPSLPTPFYSVLVSVSVFMVPSTVFLSITSPNNSPLSHSVLSSLISALLVLSTTYLFMKVSLSPDIILCG